MQKTFSSSWWLRLFWVMIGIYHFVILSYSPLPWFDETFFASISRSVMEGNGLKLEAAPFYTDNKPILIYGPVYFYLQAGIMYVVGFSEWTFRLLNLTSAAGILIFINYILRDKVEKSIRVSIVILLAFDTIFLQNAHSGRMDLLALLFIYGSYLPMLKNQTKIAYIFSSSILALLGILTTPRVIIFLVPLGCWLLYILIKEKKIIPILTFTIIFLLGYYLWILVGFGGIKSFIDYYSDQGSRKGNQSLVAAFLGGNLKVQAYQYPIILFTIGTLFIPGRKWDWLSIICVINIMLFYVIVKDTGVYSALIISFWLILLAENISGPRYPLKLKFIPLFLIGLISAGIFFLKSLTILNNKEQRNPSRIAHWIDQNIPKGSKVVGEYTYYYAVLKNNNNFQFISLGGTPEERANYHLYTYGADYIMASSETNDEVIRTYLEKIGNYEKIRIDPTPKMEQDNNFLKKILVTLHIRFTGGYEGYMYKVVRK